MSCYHPLKSYKVLGKDSYKVLGFDEFPGSGLGDFSLIPCGQCIGCRLDYSRQWADRLMLELPYHDSAYFVTLTYDNDHLPESYYPDPATGEAMPSATLVKRDVQLFFKRLRKRFSDDKIRFYCAGEYGDKTYRPHYHAIVFGLHLDDLVYYSKSSDGFTYFNSPSLAVVWPFGYVVVAEVTWETCAYTARYVTKKLKGDAAAFYDAFALCPPFSLMSRKPGIARQYYEDHPNLFDTASINLRTDKGGRKIRPPRYYDRLYDIDYPDKSRALKDMRKRMSKASQAIKLSGVSVSYLELLSIAEQNKIASTKSLLREL